MWRELGLRDRSSWRRGERGTVGARAAFSGRGNEAGHGGWGGGGVRLVTVGWRRQARVSLAAVEVRPATAGVRAVAVGQVS